MSEWGCNFSRISIEEKLKLGFKLFDFFSFLFLYMISRPPKTMSEREREREREREFLIRERERDYITIREGQFSPLALFWWALSG